MIKVSQAHWTAILVNIEVVLVKVVNKFELLLADQSFHAHFVPGTNFVQINTVATLHLEISVDNSQLGTVQEVRLLRVDDHAVSQ